MTLISLIVVLMLEHFLKASAVLEKEFHCKTWFPKWRIWLAEKLHQPWFNDWAGVLLLLGIPTLGIYFVLDANQGFLFWLIQLTLSVGILIYCLGPIDQNLHLQDYFDAVDRQDCQAAYHHIDEYIGFESLSNASEDINVLGRLVTRLIFSHANRQYFAVIIYFVLLGPAGALLYRLAISFEKIERQAETSVHHNLLTKLNQLLNWIPARLTAILFLLAGDFVSAISKLKHIILEVEYDSNLLIQETGLGAIGVKSDSELHSTEEVSKENHHALALINRTAVVLLVIIAIMTLSGWLV